MKKNSAYRVDENITKESLIAELKSGKKIGVEVMYERQQTSYYYYSKILQLNTTTGELTLDKRQCFSDTCNCVSHDQWIIKEIKIDEALKYIEDYLELREKVKLNLL
jgi:hypothetical protein